jgi:hypothetical protein
VSEEAPSARVVIGSEPSRPGPLAVSSAPYGPLVAVGLVVK